MQEGYISENLYRQFTATMPICCVDIIIHHKEKILLLKRKKEPAKNQWWTPGARLKFGETLQEAAIRIAKDETGLKVKIIKEVGVYQAFFQKGYFNRSCHCISTVFLAVPVGEVKVKLDYQSSSYKWVTTLPKHLLELYVEEPKTPFIS